MVIILLASACFAIMLYSSSLGIAFGFVAPLVLVRLVYHDETAWRVGWNFRWSRLLVAAILAPALSVFLYFLIYEFVGWGFIQITPGVQGNLHYLSPVQRVVSNFAGMAAGILLFETIIAVTLRPKVTSASNENDDGLAN